MSNLIQVDFNKKRCRNTEAEIEFDLCDLAAPADDIQDIAAHDRILELISDPGSTDTNMWSDFWVENMDVWADLYTVATDRSATKLLEDWEFNFLSNSDCVEKYQLWIDLKAQPEFRKILDITHSALCFLVEVQRAAEIQQQKEFNEEN